MWILGQITPVADMPQPTLAVLAQIATSVGLSAALVLYFVWQGWRREERFVARLEKLEDFSRLELTSALAGSAVAMNKCTTAIEMNTQTIKDMQSALMSHDRMHERKA